MDSETSAQAETTTVLSTVRPRERVSRRAASQPSPGPNWIDEARLALTSPGRFLAYEESGRRMVVPLRQGWTRIGRSLSAELRFDDSTVSRRHAVVANDGSVRILDDRSLNGIRVNGRLVEVSALRDGDVVAIGRHLLWYLDTALVGGPPAAAPTVVRAA